MITEGDRLDVADKLLDELCKIANNPKINKHFPKIIERFMLLEKEGMSVTYPSCENTENKDNWVLIEDYFKAVDNNADKSSQIMFYPMFPEDAQYSQLANYYVQRVSCSAYGCESNTITINMSCLKEETPRFLAHNFIHELGHAQIAKKEGRLFKKASRSQNERFQEEINMWTIDYKLILALGGKNYRNASKKMAFEINQWWRRERECPGHGGMGIALKHYFGNLQDRDFDNEIDITFFIYCCLMAADYYLDREKSKEKKLQIIQEIHTRQYDTEKNLMSIFSE
ncbi:MAG: hypothetical protein HY005_02680 [Candidatus Staskawiczbacteria bacterium]|nr:hypothetical protein [Candidatus Staskawiczbacteria bacterium]MBI3337503.1 hypothetical protein [Candidatus Staskawiczbacteria bacterium]